VAPAYIARAAYLSFEVPANRIIREKMIWGVQSEHLVPFLRESTPLGGSCAVADELFVLLLGQFGEIVVGPASGAASGLAACRVGKASRLCSQGASANTPWHGC
jgi:hypothetical protein